MRSAFALRIISGNIIFNRAMPERLRTLRHCIFTGGGFSRRAPSPSSLCDATSPKGRGKSTAGNFLIAPITLAIRLAAWLSLRESWRGSA